MEAQAHAVEIKRTAAVTTISVARMTFRFYRSISSNNSNNELGPPDAESIRIAVWLSTHKLLPSRDQAKIALTVLQDLNEDYSTQAPGCIPQAL